MTLTPKKPTKNLSLFLILIFGSLYLYNTWVNAVREQDEAAMNIGKTIVATIPLNELEKLDAQIGDLKKPEYQNGLFLIIFHLNLIFSVRILVLSSKRSLNSLERNSISPWSSVM